MQNVDAAVSQFLCMEVHTSTTSLQFLQLQDPGVESSGAGPDCSAIFRGAPAASGGNFVELDSLSRKNLSKGIPQSLTPAYFQNYPTDHGPGTRPKLSNSLSLFRRYFLPIPCLYFYLFLIYPCLFPAYISIYF